MEEHHKKWIKIFSTTLTDELLMLSTLVTAELMARDYDGSPEAVEAWLEGVTERKTNIQEGPEAQEEETP